MGKKAKQPEKPSTAWLGTYGDMITLMLCFFVMLYNPSEVDVTQMATITQSLQMQETETTSGGLSLSAGQLSDLGNNINSLPSLEKGKSLGLAKKKAVSLFAPDVKSNKITITSDERGLIITLLSDNFFEEGSAELNINDTRENIEVILRMCIEAQVRGVICFGMGLTLRDGSREYFYRQLDRHFPGLKERYIREFGNRYEVPSPRSDELMRLFHHTCEQNGIMHDNDEIFAYLHRFEEKEPFGQLSLWELQRNE